MHSIIKIFSLVSFVGSGKRKEITNKNIQHRKFILNIITEKKTHSKISESSNTMHQINGNTKWELAKI